MSDASAPKTLGPAVEFKSREGLDIAEKLLAAQREVRALPKDAHNAYDGYDYTSAEAILGEARRVLNGAGLTIRRDSWHLFEGPESLKDNLLLRSVFVVTDGETAEEIRSEVDYPCRAVRGSAWDKGVSAALTTSFAYWARDLLAIPRADAEVDSAADDEEEKPPKPSPKPTRRGRATGKKPRQARTPAGASAFALTAEVEEALADLLHCHKIHTPDESRSDTTLRKLAVEKFTRAGHSVTVEGVRDLIAMIEKGHEPEAERSQESTDPARSAVLDQASSSKWARETFEALRASADFADPPGDPIGFLQGEGVDLSKKQGRWKCAEMLKKGLVEWSRYAKAPSETSV